MRFPKRPLEVGLHFKEISRGGDIPASDQNVIISVLSMLRQDKARDFPQAAFGAIARHGVTHLFRTGEPDALALRFAIPTPPVLQGERGRRHPLRRGRTEKIRPRGKYRQLV
jgi:hypothetical protein